MKVGDNVKLITMEKSKEESENWILKESDSVEIGDTFIIIGVFGHPDSRWIDLKGLKLSHPADKFELVKERPDFKVLVENILTSYEGKNPTLIKEIKAQIKLIS